MSKLLKKYSHKYEYLKLELEEYQENFDDLQTKWKEIFSKYFSNIKTEVWLNEETGEIRSEKPDTKTQKPEKPTKVKKLYRKASTVSHPDKGGDIDEFNHVKSCYENNDLLGLLIYANEKNIPFEISEEDTKLLESSCVQLQDKIKALETSLIWNFFKGNDVMKKRVIQQLELEHNIKIDSKDILKKLENSE